MAKISNSPINKWANKWKRISSEEVAQKSNMYINKYSTPTAIREVQMKTTQEFISSQSELLSSRMHKKPPVNPGENVGEIIPL